MRYWDFLFGLPVSFDVATKTSPQQVRERLRRHVRWFALPFQSNLVVGRIYSESLSIEWRGSPFGFNMPPRLRGKLVSAGSSTRFVGKFGAPVLLRVFLATWVCFDATILFSLLRAPTSDLNAPAWAIFLFLTAHCLMPFGFSAIGLIGAESSLKKLTDFIIQTGSAGMERQS